MLGKYNLSEIRKATSMFLVGLAGFLAVSLPLVTDGTVTNADVVAIISALAVWLGGTGVVFKVPNEEK